MQRPSTSDMKLKGDARSGANITDSVTWESAMDASGRVEKEVAFAYGQVGVSQAMLPVECLKCHGYQGKALFVGH